MNIEMIVKVVIPILGAVITYILIPFIKEYTTKQERENIYFWVKVAVQAAEMIIKESGKEKKEYVLQYLVSRNIKISMDDLDVLIESAVKELRL